MPYYNNSFRPVPNPGITFWILKYLLYRYNSIPNARFLNNTFVNIKLDILCILVCVSYRYTSISNSWFLSNTLVNINPDMNLSLFLYLSFKIQVVLTLSYNIWFVSIQKTLYIYSEVSVFQDKPQCNTLVCNESRYTTLCIS